MTRLNQLLDSGTALAVVGMALRVPGARNVREYWANLREGRESIRDLDPEELAAGGVPRELLDDPAYVRRAAVLDGMDRFDAGFFGFSPRDAEILDPQHRHFLEVAWEALEDAGHVPGRFPGPVGVFAGSGTNAYFWANLLTNSELVRDVGFFLLRHTGNDKDFLSTRVSYEFDLQGPSVNIQTACSTSLVAVHAAGQSLLSGECDMALAGGVTIEQPHGHGYLHKEGEILSPDGHCRAFDADARGTVFGSGVGVVVLRRLADAVADGDTVHAVVLGSAVNNDGSMKVGYLAPSVEGQARAVAEALAVSGVEPAELGFVAAHGTGTEVGDPIEVTALTQAFRAGTSDTGFCALGSVKANIGHLDTAAGVASLVQAICALKAKEIPPTVHFQQPNPGVDFASSPFYVPATLAPWASDGPRRAGVNSLGVGGTNAFVVLEEAPALEPSGPGRALELVTLSGRSRRVLEAAGGDLVDFMEEAEADDTAPAPALADVAWTLATGRRGFRHRRAVVAANRAELVEALVTGDETRTSTAEAMEPAPGVVFLFAGGGAQYPGMGSGLYHAEPEYRQVVDDCLGQLDPGLASRVRALLLEPASDGDARPSPDAERPSVALPALFITQLAQGLLWRSWGVEPASMVGHSMGEYTAACLAGVLSRRDALSMVVIRGHLFETLPAGGMLSVSLSEEELRPRLPEGLSLAAVNAPGLTVASGPVPLLETLQGRLEAEEIECRRVRIGVAAHSSMLAPILEPFEAHLRTMELHPPRIPFSSNLSGEWITAEEAIDPAYWVRQLRETVRFADGVRRARREGNPVLLEVGPGRTLATLARMNAGEGEDIVALTSMRHPDDEEADDLAFQLGTLGRLWTLGFEVHWEAFYAGQARRKVPLPTYPFERERYFVEPGRALPLQFGAEASSAVGRDAKQAADAMATWFHRATWEVAPLESDAPPEAPVGAVLVVGKTPGAVVGALRAKGRRTIEVELGEGFQGTTPEAWRTLLASLEERGESVEALVYLPLLEPGPAREVEAFEIPFALLKALGEEDRTDPLPLLVAATGLHAVTSDDIVDPVKSLVLGPVRVAPREIPWLRARAIDVDAATAADPVRLARILGAELDHEAPEPVSAWRGETRRVERFHTLPLPLDGDAAGAGDHDAAGSWLITGGLGGLGLSLARDLAERGARHLVLLSRSGLPPREAWPDWKEALSDSDPTIRRIASVEELEALGCRVDTPAADVADETALRQALGPLLEAGGVLRGVVHAAGILDDAPILAKELDDARRVLSPKVAGTRALARVLEARRPERVVLFSSRSAFSGAPGQVDYTSANAFLDAWARRARHDQNGAEAPPRVLSVEWDIWKETGMAFELSEGAVADAPRVVSVERLDDPVFRHRIRTADGAVFVQASLRDTSHWMLDEHRLRGGPALIPGSGFMELLRSALSLRVPDAGTHPAQPGAVTLRDVLFLQPFRVPPGEGRELAVRMRETGRGAVELTVLGRSGAAEPWTEHVRGLADAGASPAPSTVNLKKLLRACRAGLLEVDGSAGNPLLDFGPRWSCLRTIHLGEGEAVLEIALPQAYHADLEDHPLHPAILDVATGTVQTLRASGGWGGSGAEVGEPEDYVPASYASLEMRGPLPPVVFSHVRFHDEVADGMAVFDISLLDAEGREVVAVQEFVMLRVERDELLASAAPAPGEAMGQNVRAGAASPVPGIDEGLATADGLRALRRLLRAPELPPVVAVVPRDLQALLRELDENVPGANRPPEVDVSEVVAALGAHPAVVDATAVAHPYGEDEVRVVAFVVYDPAVPATVSELRRFVKARVPAGLVPQNFVEMTEIPRDARGRVDRAGLDDPFAPRDDHVAPRTPTEEVLAEIWASLLGLSRVSVHDNFLDVGGHSLVGIRVLLQIEKRTGVRLHPNALTLQTLEQLAAECDRRSDEAPPSEGGQGSPEAEKGLASRLLTAMKGTVSRG
jgi:acyl transferase domain-containing protein